MTNSIVKARMARRIRPARKVTATSLASAFSVLVLWTLNTWVLAEPVSAEVGAAIGTVMLFVVPFAVGWMVPPSPRDGIRTFVDNTPVPEPTQ